MDGEKTDLENGDIIQIMRKNQREPSTKNIGYFSK